MDPEVVEAPVVTEEARIIYEQDIRAGTHSNGRAPHLVDAQVKPGGDEPPPPELPEEPEYNRGGEPAKRNDLLAYALAFTYLGAGSIALWIGVTMIRDIRGKEKKT